MNQSLPNSTSKHKFDPTNLFLYYPIVAPKKHNKKPNIKIEPLKIAPKPTLPLTQTINTHLTNSTIYFHHCPQCGLHMNH